MLHDKRPQPATLVCRAAMTAAFAISLAVMSGVQPPAAMAGRRKPAAPQEKKEKPNPELSGYQLKLLEASKRKDALKAAVEARKAAATS